MAFIPVPNTAMVELFFTQDGQQLENTLYFQRGDTYDTTELTTLAEAIIDWWVGEMQSWTSNTVLLRSVKATSLESDSAPAVEVAPPTPQGGASASAALPNNVTIAVKFLTAFRGRWARGRNYIVGLTEPLVIGNELDAAQAAGIVASYNELLGTTYVPAGYNWVVVSRQFNNVPRVTGFAAEVTGAALTDYVLDSQRRRLPGRGR
jgi:hypothetical protein